MPARQEPGSGRRRAIENGAVFLVLLAVVIILAFLA